MSSTYRIISLLLVAFLLLVHKSESALDSGCKQQSKYESYMDIYKMIGRKTYDSLSVHFSAEALSNIRCDLEKCKKEEDEEKLSMECIVNLVKMISMKKMADAAPNSDMSFMG